MPDESRHYERVMLPLEVRWEDSLSGKHTARVSDLGLGGCYIESLAQVAVGERIRFEVQLPAGGWMPLRGEVMHVQPSLGFGVRFTEQTMMERNLLEHFIKAVLEKQA
jgi:hypothetical protein